MHSEVLLDPVGQGVALLAGQRVHQMLDDLRVGVHRRERLAVGRPPAAGRRPARSRSSARRSRRRCYANRFGGRPGGHHLSGASHRSVHPCRDARGAAPAPPAGPAQRGRPERAAAASRSSFDHRLAANGGDPLADDDLQLALFTYCKQPCRYVRGRRSRGGVAAVAAGRPAVTRGALRAGAARGGHGARRRPRSRSRRPCGRWSPPTRRPRSPGHSSVTRRPSRYSEFLIHRSTYQLKEADPHSWAVPRLAGRPKEALVEVQADEYGGGAAGRCTPPCRAFVRALGLDDRYGASSTRLPGDDARYCQPDVADGSAPAVARGGDRRTPGGVRDDLAGA